MILHNLALCSFISKNTIKNIYDRSLTSLLHNIWWIPQIRIPLHISRNVMHIITSRNKIAICIWIKICHISIKACILISKRLTWVKVIQILKLIKILKLSRNSFIFRNVQLIVDIDPISNKNYQKNHEYCIDNEGNYCWIKKPHQEERRKMKKK